MKKALSRKNLAETAGSRAGQAVYSALLRGLSSGELPPGSRLPTRRDLIKRFATTPVTVQRAFDRLAEAGFIESRGKLGTYVVDYPPNLHRVALVFKAAPGDPEWRRFWTVLIHAAANLVHEDHWRFEPYYCVRADDPGPDLARLCHDAAEHRLAGIFYANTPPALPAVRRLHVPCVAVTAFDLDWLTTITIDQEDFLRKSVDWLAKRGCHRIGLLAVPTYDETLLPAFREQVAASGMSYAERWLQLCNQSYPHWAANITELLFSTASKTRPDGLIIADDNLTADACRGLSAAGLEPGRHVHVVSHANFPAANQPGNSGVQRIGYDNTMILRQVLDCISNKTHPRKNPSRIVIAACLESDSLQNTPAANLQRQLPSR